MGRDISEQLQEISEAVADIEFERDRYRRLLLRCQQALNDWTTSYAAEFCDPKHVKETFDRIIDNGGTLAYIAEINKDLRETLELFENRHVNK